MGWRIIPADNQYSKQLTQMTDSETGPLRKTTTFEGERKRLVVKWAPLFYKSVFREKSRAGNVDANHPQAKNVDLEHAG